LSHHLGNRRHHGLGWGLGARDGDAGAAKTCSEPERQVVTSIRPRSERTRRRGGTPRGPNKKVACREVDPLVADEHGDLALEDVERLVLVVWVRVEAALGEA
jgi:hypothetical protein